MVVKFQFFISLFSVLFLNKVYLYKKSSNLRTSSLWKNFKRYFIRLTRIKALFVVLSYVYLSTEFFHTFDVLRSKNRSCWNEIQKSVYLTVHGIASLWRRWPNNLAVFRSLFVSSWWHASYWKETFAKYWLGSPVFKSLTFSAPYWQVLGASRTLSSFLPLHASPRKEFRIGNWFTPLTHYIQMSCMSRRRSGDFSGPILIGPKSTTTHTTLFFLPWLNKKGKSETRVFGACTSIWKL